MNSKWAPEDRNSPLADTPGSVSPPARPLTEDDLEGFTPAQWEDVKATERKRKIRMTMGYTSWDMELPPNTKVSSGDEPR